MTMQKISQKDFEDLKPKLISEKEWLSLSPTYCCICKKFIVHWWDAWGTPQPAFSSDVKIGGWYCSSHTSEELISAQQIRLAVNNRFCKLDLGQLEFFEMYPNQDKPVSAGYVFTSRYSKEELCVLVMEWYAGVEIELLT
jgi:hypothetical protein